MRLGILPAEPLRTLQGREVGLLWQAHHGQGLSHAGEPDTCALNAQRMHAAWHRHRRSSLVSNVIGRAQRVLLVLDAPPLPDVGERGAPEQRRVAHVHAERQVPQPRHQRPPARLVRAAEQDALRADALVQPAAGAGAYPLACVWQLPQPPKGHARPVSDACCKDAGTQDHRSLDADA